MTKSYQPIDEEKLRKLWPTRLSDKELAERLGHHKGVIRRKAKMLGLPLRKEIWAGITKAPPKKALPDRRYRAAW